MPKKSSKKHTVLIVLGTRPEVIRFAPIIKQLQLHPNIKTKVLHTGQHYTDSMSKVFFDDLNLKHPDYNLNAGGLDPSAQIIKITKGFTKIATELNPDLVCVWGDTNSSLYTGLAANKLKLRLAHIEAGCRSRGTGRPGSSLGRGFPQRVALSSCPRYCRCGLP